MMILHSRRFYLEPLSYFWSDFNQVPIKKLRPVFTSVESLLSKLGTNKGCFWLIYTSWLCLRRPRGSRSSGIFLIRCLTMGRSLSRFLLLWMDFFMGLRFPFWIRRVLRNSFLMFILWYFLNLKSFCSKTDWIKTSWFLFKWLIRLRVLFIFIRCWFWMILVSWVLRISSGIWIWGFWVWSFWLKFWMRILEGFLSCWKK